MASGESSASSQAPVKNNIPHLLAPSEDDDLEKLLSTFEDTRNEPLSNFIASVKRNSACWKYINDELCDEGSNIPTRKTAEAVLLRLSLPAKTAPPAVTSESFIARKSLFTQQEQFQLFLYFLSIQNKKTPREDQKSFYQEREQQLHEEQMCYLSYARQEWLSDKYKKLSAIRDDVLKFVNECRKAKLERIHRWPGHYEKTGLIPLALNSEISLKFITNLLAIGDSGLPKYRYYDVSEGLSIYDVLPSLTPSRNTQHPTGVVKCLKRFSTRKHFNPDISRDSNASNIALTNDVHVVMSESAFCTLISNHNGVIQTWRLPVVVKELGIGGETKKVVFVGSKLPPCEMNVRDRLKYFAKASLEEIFLSDPKQVNSEEFPANGLARNIDKLIELEEFGFSKDPADVNHSVIQNECSKEETVTEMKNPERKIKCHTKYSLFECSPVDNCNPMMKNALIKKYNILIRTTDKGTYGPVGAPCKIVPKLEYQSELGFEILTPEECAKEWSSLFIRPKSVLKRVRLNPVSGKVLRVENLTLDNVSRDWVRTHGVDPNTKLRIVYNVVNTLWSLSNGNYLLARSADQGLAANIYKESERSGCSISFYQTANPDLVSPETTSWIPLDRTILSPVSHYFNRPPCTFSPRRKFCSPTQENTKQRPCKMRKKKKEDDSKRKKKKRKLKASDRRGRRGV